MSRVHRAHDRPLDPGCGRCRELTVADLNDAYLEFALGLDQATFTALTDPSSPIAHAELLPLRYKMRSAGALDVRAETQALADAHLPASSELIRRVSTLSILMLLANDARRMQTMVAELQRRGEAAPQITAALELVTGLEVSP